MDPEKVAAVVELQQAIASALVSGDDRFLEAIYAPDYTFVNSDGVVRTTREVLDGRARGDLKTESLTYDQLKVRLYGDVAVVTGRATVSAVMYGRRFGGQSRFVRVQVHHAGSWTVVHYQVTGVETHRQSPDPTDIPS